MKRTFCVALAAILLLALLPMGTLAENATAMVGADEIQSRIDTLVELLDGTYFTTAHSSGCTDASHYTAVCNTCFNGYVFTSDWFEDMFGTVTTDQIPGIGVSSRASSCAGFANFAEWYIFKNDPSDTVAADMMEPAAFDQSHMTEYARPGDAVRVDGRHSFIFIRANETSVTVLDCNYDGHSQVQKHEIPYSDYSTAVIYRAANSAYTVGDFTVTLNANGGRIAGTSSAEITVAYGAKYGALQTPIRAGYTFDGWYTARFGGTRVTGNTTADLTEDQTLYAHWTARTYTLTLNANDGEIADGKTYRTTVTFGARYGAFPTPTRDGYTFVGWYTARSGGTRVTAGARVSTARAQTLYAHWTKTE